MKRTWIRAGIVAVLVGWSTASVTTAQESGSNQRNKGKSSKNTIRPSKKRDRPRRNEGGLQRSAPRTETGPHREVDQLKKLQEAMKEGLELSSEQEKVIVQLFVDQFRKLEKTRDRRKAKRDNPRNIAEIKELREKMNKARKEGNKETVRELRQQFRRKLQGRRPLLRPAHAQFLATLKAKLNEGQRDSFEKIVAQLGIRERSAPPGQRLKLMGRVVRQSSLGFSDAQRSAAIATIRKARSEINETGGDRYRAREAVDQAYAQITESLSSEQRAKFDAELQRVEKRGRVRQRPGRVTEQPGTDTDSEEGDKESEPTKDDEDE